MKKQLKHAISILLSRNAISDSYDYDCLISAGFPMNESTKPLLRVTTGTLNYYTDQTLKAIVYVWESGE